MGYYGYVQQCFATESHLQGNSQRNPDCEYCFNLPAFQRKLKQKCYFQKSILYGKDFCKY